MLFSSSERAAKLVYGPSDFRMLSNGTFVTCAVTGEEIPLEQLRYWSAERQEAYASAEISTKRFLGQV